MLVFFIWPAVAAGVGLIGGIIGNRARSREAKKNRRFQERMRNTSWQAGVADMEKAGINPALAYGQGGASSPGGSMASQDDVLSGSVTSAMDARRLKAQVNLMEDQSTKAYEDAKLSKNQAAESAARREMIFKTQTHQQIINELAGLSLFSARNIAQVSKGKFGQVMSYADRLRGMGPRLNLGYSHRASTFEMIRK